MVANIQSSNGANTEVKILLVRQKKEGLFPTGILNTHTVHRNRLYNTTDASLIGLVINEMEKKGWPENVT